MTELEKNVAAASQGRNKSKSAELLTGQNAVKSTEAVHLACLEQSYRRDGMLVSLGLQGQTQPALVVGGLVIRETRERLSSE